MIAIMDFDKVLDTRKGVKGHLYFRMTPEIEVVVALGIEQAIESTWDVMRNTLRKELAMPGCSVFECLLLHVGVEFLKPIKSLEDNVPRYGADFCLGTWYGKSIFPILTYLAECGVGIDGYFEEEEDDPFEIHAELNERKLRFLNYEDILLIV